MSATGRKLHSADGGKETTQRLDQDAYETPAWVVRTLLQNVALPGGRWLEPCAGDGSIIRAVREMVPPAPVTWTACEIRPECAKPLADTIPWNRVSIADFLALPSERVGQYDVILTNPPFSLAAEFVNACLPLSNCVVFLQRLNFLGGAQRAPFWRSHMPDVYVLPNRPSFVHGRTDSTEYAWFRWHGMQVRTEGKVFVLPPLSVEERSSGAVQIGSL